ASTPIERAATPMETSARRPLATRPTAFTFAFGDAEIGARPIDEAVRGVATGSQLSLSWAELEPRNGSFELARLRAFQSKLPANGTALVHIRVPDDAQLGAPADLGIRSVADPEVQARLAALFDALVPALDPRVRYLSIGSHVELFFRAHPEQIDAYIAFASTLSDRISKQRAGLGLGVMSSYRAWSDPNLNPPLKRLSRYADLLYLSYLPESADAPWTDIPRMLELANGHGVVIQEMGYPAGTEATEQQQAEVLRALLETGAAARGRLRHVTWIYLDDLSDSRCDALVAEEFRSSARQRDLVCRLGLRRPDGSFKQGWQRLRARVAPF
ncbi:MAG TPA: hypothetical protein VJR89_34455, partial [Polyangiales bacterium]|nr:hypothetical protein [Polyangiales bacterium]